VVATVNAAYCVKDIIAREGEAMTLILKRASASRPSGEWNDDDFDVLADGAVVSAYHRNQGSLRQQWRHACKFRQVELALSIMPSSMLRRCG
jgi:hypothetical protein